MKPFTKVFESMLTKPATPTWTPTPPVQGGPTQGWGWGGAPEGIWGWGGSPEV